CSWIRRPTHPVHRSTSTPSNRRRWYSSAAWLRRRHGDRRPLACTPPAPGGEPGGAVVAGSAGRRLGQRRPGLLHGPVGRVVLGLGGGGAAAGGAAAADPGQDRADGRGTLAAPAPDSRSGLRRRGRLPA